MNQKTLNDSSSFEYQQLFGRLGKFISSVSPFEQEILPAKEQYMVLTGKIRENSNSYDARMNAFLEWFIFDRVAENKQTPLESYLEKIKAENNLKDLIFYESLLSNIHSIFKFVKTNRDRIILKDMFSQNKYTINETHILFGVEKGTLFESRLLQKNDSEYCLSSYCIPHPQDMTRPITRAIKKLKNDAIAFQALIFKLQLFYTKWENYKLIDIRSIYHFDDRYPEAK